MAWHNGKWWPLFVPEWYHPRASQHFFDPYSLLHVLHGFIYFGLWGWWFIETIFNAILKSKMKNPEDFIDEMFPDRLEFSRDSRGIDDLNEDAKEKFRDNFAIYYVYWGMAIGVVLVVLAELLFKSFVNSEFNIIRMRSNSGTCEDYSGESYQNILGDIVAAVFGWYLVALCHGPSLLGLWFDSIPSWLPLVLVVPWYLITEVLLLVLIGDCGLLIALMWCCPIRYIKTWQAEKIEGNKRRIQEEDFLGELGSKAERIERGTGEYAANGEPEIQEKMELVRELGAKAEKREKGSGEYAPHRKPEIEEEKFRIESEEKDELIEGKSEKSDKNMP